MIQGDLTSSSLSLAQDVDLLTAFTKMKIEKHVPVFRGQKIPAGSEHTFLSISASFGSQNWVSGHPNPPSHPLGLFLSPCSPWAADEMEHMQGISARTPHLITKRKINSEEIIKLNHPKRICNRAADDCMLPWHPLLWMQEISSRKCLISNCNKSTSECPAALRHVDSPSDHVPGLLLTCSGVASSAHSSHRWMPCLLWELGTFQQAQCRHHLAFNQNLFIASNKTMNPLHNTWSRFSNLVRKKSVPCLVVSILHWNDD